MSDEDQAMPSGEAVTDDIDIPAEEVTQTVTDAQEPPHESTEG